VASVHANSCVIGDVNHSGFLVSDKATITLIDSDSFQVAASGRDFLCAVGTPEYTPPELQGVHFDRVKRTSNHDNFGLAVLVFQLLFMGRHPFSGRFLGAGDMPLERAIKEFRFAYSADRRATQMEPPPAVPLLSDFPDYVSTAFERAFGRAGAGGRPSAEEWANLLGRLEGELQRCSANDAHHHTKGKPCPWCRMEQANPGFIAFLSTGGFATGAIQLDLASLTKLLESLPDPGPTPDINSVINAVPPNTPVGVASPGARRQHGGSIFASVGGLALAFVTSSSVPLALPGSYS
jgi:DNA-binding helix-hairpin-helix protein with protein kinase domain